jgi:hypothetical protein
MQLRKCFTCGPFTERKISAITNPRIMKKTNLEYFSADSLLTFATDRQSREENKHYV